MKFSKQRRQKEKATQDGIWQIKPPTRPLAMETRPHLWGTASRMLLSAASLPDRDPARSRGESLPPSRCHRRRLCGGSASAAAGWSSGRLCCRSESPTHRCIILNHGVVNRLLLNKVEVIIIFLLGALDIASRKLGTFWMSSFCFVQLFIDPWLSVRTVTRISVSFSNKIPVVAPTAQTCMWVRNTDSTVQIHSLQRKDKEWIWVCCRTLLLQLPQCYEWMLV